MADQEEEQTTTTTKPAFPIGRVKKIIKLDKQITRITSEALHLISDSTHLFLQFLADNSADIASQNKRKTIKLDHLHLAVKRHQPTRDFLLDSLPLPPQPSDHHVNDRTVVVKEKEKEKVGMRNVRRIDSFFCKTKNDDAVAGDGCEGDLEKEVVNDDVNE